MRFGFSRPKFENLDRYVANKEYEKALQAVANELMRNPSQFNLLLRQAEILGLAGNRDQAINVYRELAERYARDGFYAKAAAAVATPAAEVEQPSSQEAKEIQASTLFASFHEQALEEILTSTSLRSYHEGDIIVTEGEEGSSLFLIVSGEVKVFTRGQRGEHRARSGKDRSDAHDHSQKTADGL